MRIRLATTDDLGVLEKLVGYFWDEQVEKYGLVRLEAATFGMIQFGIQTGQAVVVAEQEEDGAVVGWVARVTTPGLPPGLAVGVGKWTYEPFRRERVCRDMTRMADEHAARMGVTALTGEVALENEAGMRSAIADGWKVVSYGIRKELQPELVDAIPATEVRCPAT
jgi:hypothetical protein